MNQSATVFVVDDDATTRSLVERLATSMGLDARCYVSAEQFLEQLDASIPGCLVLDLMMSGMSGLDLQARLIKEEARWPVIILTAHGDVESAVRAMKLKAMDFVQKPFTPERLGSLIQRAIELDARQRKQLLYKQEILERSRHLSPREREVMGLVVQGMANKRIARTLGLSEKTIEVHRGNVMRKMKAESLADLVRIVMLMESATTLP